MSYICAKCGIKYELITKKYYCDCGGLFKLDYKAKFDLAKIHRDRWNIFRYSEFLPLQTDYESLTLGEGMTPIIEYKDNILLKVDYAMPTLSFKDRGAVVVIGLCRQLGVKSVFQDSSGNAGNSIAAYSARCGIECEIFVPKGTSPKKISMIESHGAKVNVVDGNRDATAKACREKAFSGDNFYASHVYNPFFYQGTKTYIYEIFEQLGRVPDNLIIPLGNGTLFIGVIIALEELMDSGYIENMPKILAVQTERCAPIYQGYINKSSIPLKITPIETLAEGIAIGEPMRGEEILEYIYKYNVEVIVAREDSIISAQDELAKSGLFVETTTAANLSAYYDYIADNNLSGDVLITLCGAGLKSLK